jgi:hypothetical protein
MPDIDTLLTPSEVANMFNISEMTLKRLRLAGQGPPAVFLSARTIRYRPQAVAKWMDEQTGQGSSSAKKDQPHDNNNSTSIGGDTKTNT